MSREIRLAVVEDAAAIGRLHVRAWKAAYRGLMPDGYLDALQPDSREAMWRKHLSAAPLGHRVLVSVALEEGEVLGFAALGPESNRAEAERGELYALYVEPARWVSGIGRQLLAESVERLRGLGYAEAVLWVATGNTRARRFYEGQGWAADGTARQEKVLGAEVDAVRYARRL
jgi:GNAT superfamily N-acetyltransferase